MSNLHSCSLERASDGKGFVLSSQLSLLAIQRRIPFRFTNTLYLQRSQRTWMASSAVQAGCIRVVVAVPPERENTAAAFYSFRESGSSRNIKEEEKEEKKKAPLR